MPVDDTTGIIQRVLNEFGLSNPAIELLSSTDHCNARIVTGSDNYFLKILAGDCTQAQLRSRLRFSDFLREGGLPIPAVLETSTGRRFATTSVAGEERLAVLSAWIEGETLGDRTEAHWIEKCGELLARLHVRSQAFDPPDDFEVREWDQVYAPPEEGWLVPFLAAEPFDDQAQETIQNAAARARTLDSRLPRDRQAYGLIHADFHGDNLIFDGQTIWIVDLEDVGWGHFLFDIAWSNVLFARHHPGAGPSLEPLLRGYERIRPLSPAEIELLPEFQLAAGIGVLEMVYASPVANDGPLAHEWFDFAVRWLRTHLS